VGVRDSPRGEVSDAPQSAVGKVTHNRAPSRACVEHICYAGLAQDAIRLVRWATGVDSNEPRGQLAELAPLGIAVVGRPQIVGVGIQHCTVGQRQHGPVTLVPHEARRRYGREVPQRKFFMSMMSLLL
jgi:hypothetical protein